MTNNKLFIIALILILFSQSCRVDITNYFNDYKKINELCVSYRDTFDAENYDFHVGIKHRNEIEYSVLRYTFSNVKINLVDSLLHKRSKTFAKLVYDNLKNKDQFDMIEIQFIKDPLQDTNIKENINGFIPNKLSLSFDTFELNDSN